MIPKSIGIKVITQTAGDEQEIGEGLDATKMMPSQRARPPQT